MSPVSRLRKTWSKVKTAKFYILEVRERHLDGSGSQMTKLKQSDRPVLLLFLDSKDLKFPHKHF